MMKVERIFSDHMILQRNHVNPVFGYGENGDVISVKMQDAVVKTLVNDNKWIAYLPEMEAGTEYEIVITSLLEDQTIVISDVAVGDVWLAGGQSNMEFPMHADRDLQAELMQADDKYFRFFDYPEVGYEEAFEEYPDSYRTSGFWRKLTKEDLPFFSAVGYYFGKRIRREENVPVGIVGCNWGGTSAAAWTDAVYLQKDRDLKRIIEGYESVLTQLDMEEYEKWHRKAKGAEFAQKFGAVLDALLVEGPTAEMMQKYPMSPEDTAEFYEVVMPKIGPKSEFRPCGLYHTMVRHVAPYGIKGVIWYQGESDDIRAEIYDKSMHALVECWRDTWGYKMPFLYVQIAALENWGGMPATRYPEIRAMQDKVSKEIEDAYMVSIMDCGDPFDVHPKNKSVVGERLALMALGKVYGRDVLCESPEMCSASRTGKCIEILFENTGEGFDLQGEQVEALEVYQDDQLIEDVVVQVKQHSLLLTLPENLAGGLVKVKYAWKPYCIVNLYSSADLPVKPFTVEI